MHRHGYQGRKFGRERDQRQALIMGLADSLVLNTSIETTFPKAKEVARYTEQVITKAKKGDLHNRRQVIKALSTLEAAHKLVDDIAPKLGGRPSGYFRIERTRLRRGDGAQMAKVSFVDDLSEETKPVKTAAKAEPKPTSKPAAQKRPAAKKPAGVSK